MKTKENRRMEKMEAKQFLNELNAAVSKPGKKESPRLSYAEERQRAWDELDAQAKAQPLQAVSSPPEGQRESAALGFRWHTWALSAEVSKPAHRLMLVALAAHADNLTGRCHPSRRRLASICLCSRRSVTRTIAELVAMGLVVIEARHKDSTRLSNGYRLVSAL